MIEKMDYAHEPQYDRNLIAAIIDQALFDATNLKKKPLKHDLSLWKEAKSFFSIHNFVFTTYCEFLDLDPLAVSEKAIKEINRINGEKIMPFYLLKSDENFKEYEDNLIEISRIESIHVEEGENKKVPEFPIKVYRILVVMFSGDTILAFFNKIERVETVIHELLRGKITDEMVKNMTKKFKIKSQEKPKINKDSPLDKAIRDHFGDIPQFESVNAILVEST